jgi:hypothetical protein
MTFMADKWLDTVVRPAEPLAVALGIERPEILLGLGVSLLAFGMVLAVGLLLLGRRGLCPPAVHCTSCRWTWGQWRAGTRFCRWQCATCGVEAYTMTKRPPRECKRTSRPGSL